VWANLLCMTTIMRQSWISHFIFLWESTDLNLKTRKTLNGENLIWKFFILDYWNWMMKNHFSMGHAFCKEHLK
jgi:hypothetical protein